MYCPLCTNKYGQLLDCHAEECAWWDFALKQCCIKTMSIAPILTNEAGKPSQRPLEAWAEEPAGRYAV